MITKVVKNFTDMADVEISTLTGADSIQFVIITACSGNMRFQHTMTVVQALEMANALLDTALEIQKGGAL